MTIRTSLFALAVAVLVSSAPTVAQPGKDKQEKKRGASSGVEVSASVSFSFGSRDAGEIRAWFGNPSNAAGLPPGLAKKDDLPPGLQKQLVRNGTLPPGLEKKLQPLPAELRGRIARAPAGVDLVYMSDRVLAVHVESSKILDVVLDIVIPF